MQTLNKKISQIVSLIKLVWFKKSQTATLPACHLPGNGTPIWASHQLGSMTAGFSQVEPNLANMRSKIRVFFKLE